MDQYGIYFDEISKFDAMWKFTRRTFVPILIAQGTIAGDIVTPQRSLDRSDALHTPDLPVSSTTPRGHESPLRTSAPIDESTWPVGVPYQHVLALHPRER